MEKNMSQTYKIVRVFLVACSLLVLAQSAHGEVPQNKENSALEQERTRKKDAPIRPYSFQAFKKAFKETYPTLDTPLKDLKVFWNYGTKKIRFQKISKEESQAFWRAVKRTGIPLTVILGIISGGIY